MRHTDAGSGGMEGGEEIPGSDVRKVIVDLGASSYPVLVGKGVRSQVSTLLSESVKRVAVITQAGIPWGVETMREELRIELPPGESAKRLAVVERACSEMAKAGLTRADAVVAVGGGVVTDLAGFVAAVYHRGIEVLHVPTTLLAQVDAAIGGKCGVNLDEGKNLVGAFWQPKAVLCDTETLSSLPECEQLNGRGEMAKYAFLGVPNLAGVPLDQQVAQCVGHKAAVVSEDEREGGRRALLNYGHTLAHAIEAQALHHGNTIGHGEAVAVGLHFAALLATRMGRVGPEEVEKHLAVLDRLGLPTALPGYVEVGETLEYMARDKKAVDGLTFVLMGDSGCEVVSGVSPDLVAEVLQSMPTAL